MPEHGIWLLVQVDDARAMTELGIERMRSALPLEADDRDGHHIDHVAVLLEEALPAFEPLTPQPVFGGEEVPERPACKGDAGVARRRCPEVGLPQDRHDA